ncbi:hypothetical protein PG984_005643 [Apiospora sp. TS-2023a]
MNNNITQGTITDGPRMHGGLMQSIHCSVQDTVQGHVQDTVQAPVQNPVQGPAQGPIHQSIHGPTYRLANGRNYGYANSAAANRACDGPLNPHATVSSYNDSYSNTRMPTYGTAGRTQIGQGFNPGDCKPVELNPVPVVSIPVDKKLVDTQPNSTHTIDNDVIETKNEFHAQFQSIIRDSRKIKAMTGAYILEKDDRDELWDYLNLKIPKYHGYECWAIPFPAGMDFFNLAQVGCNSTYEFVDSRFVRVMFRQHLDKDGKTVANDILLTPSNPSIDLMDVRLHSALMDGYWKLSRWLAKLVSGDEVNLEEFLKADLQSELKVKKERTI